MVESQKIPLWAKKILSESAVKNLSDLVQQSELKTQGEIVPMLVKRSSAIGHVPLLITALFMIVTLAFERWWITTFWGAWPTWVYLPATLCYFGIAVFLSRFHFLQRWLTNDQDEATQVLRRAELEFRLSPVHRTRQGTGILIFASLMEKRAVILADEAISSRVNPEIWSEVAQILTSEFKQGNYALGYEKAIKRCSKLLETHLPAQRENPNEICNGIVIKD